jgi:hypothetical protein
LNNGSRRGGHSVQFKFLLAFLKFDDIMDMVSTTDMFNLPFIEEYEVISHSIFPLDERKAPALQMGVDEIHRQPAELMARERSFGAPFQSDAINHLGLTSARQAKFIYAYPALYISLDRINAPIQIKIIKEK